MKNVACIFVNYNNSQESINCIASVANASAGIARVKVIIVDNASADLEREKLRQYVDNICFPDCTVNLIFLETNIGYFPALNHGFIENRSFINNCDYVVMGNNDLVFTENFMSILASRTYDSQVYVVAPNIINRDSNHQNPQIIYRYSRSQLLFLDLYHSSYLMASLITFVSRFLKFRGSQKSKAGHDTSQFISIGYGACYILTRSYINVVGMIPAYLFLMNEENALSHAVHSSSGRIFYDAGLVVHHMEHTSVNMFPKKKLFKIAQESYRISKIHFNNRYLFDKQIGSE